MSFKEITHCVQRLEMLEERAGIEIRGLMASVDDEVHDGEYYVQVMGEIIAINGGTIDNNVDIDINCYNSKQQVCGASSVYLSSEDFVGFETLNSFISSRGFPVEIKIVPKVMK